MKKLFTILCAAVIAVGAINAEVLFTEHFAQTTETLASNGNALGDEIASSGWTNISGGNAIYMNDADLIYAGYKSVTDGTRCAETKSTSGVKKVASPLKKAVNSGSVYMAAIIDLKDYATTSATSSTRDYLLTFCNGTSAVSTAGNCYGRLTMQKIADGQFQFGVAKRGESAAYISYTGTLSYGKYLVVLEYEFVSGDNNDVVKLYLNPTKGDKPAATIECKQSAQNPSTSAEVGSNTQVDASQLKSIVINASSYFKASMLIDEIKVATSWADLWESETPDPEVPAINVESSVAFGNVTVGTPAEKKVTVSAANLKGAVSVASDNAALVPSATSITKAEAEAGYELTLTLTAATAGEGNAKITLSSQDATSKEIAVSWTAAEPVATITIAQAKLRVEGAEVALNDVVIIRAFGEGFFSVQDATGALNIVDYYSVGTSWKVGDKISDISGIIMDSESNVEGFCTVFPMAGNVAASGVAVEPFAVTLAEFAKYGPAYVKVEGVSFPAEATQFAAGGITISQDAASANMQILAGCDIIGEEVPAKADVKGIVCHPYFTDNILIGVSTDVYNRVAKEPTAIDAINTGHKAVKTIVNGQMVILKDGKTFNVLGTELK